MILKGSSTLPPLLKATSAMTCLQMQQQSGIICNATYKAVVDAYGSRVRNNTDWYEANLNVMEPLTAAKMLALIQYKKDPNRKNLVSLQEARRKSHSWHGTVQMNTG